MWIIPKNLHTSLYVQDMEGLTLDLSELSTMCEQSLMWRSKLFNVRTWSQRWKRVGWMQHLYGRILKPSRGQAFMEKWTSLVVASLVSPSQVQAKKIEMKTRATFGHTSSKEFNSVDHPLFSWKTLKELSAQNYKAINGMTQKELQFCSMCLGSWRDWIIKQRQAYSQRLKLAHLTKEKECLYWVAKTMPANYSWKEILKKTFIQTQEGKVNTNLSHQERYTQALNPRWVDCLMGLPIGWTYPTCTQLVVIEPMNLEVLEMESSQVQQAEHLKPYGKNWNTPPASQRGENLRHYLNRMKSRINRGFNQPFAPTLQIQVEAEGKGIDIKQELKKLKHD